MTWFAATAKQPGINFVLISSFASNGGYFKKIFHSFFRDIFLKVLVEYYHGY